VTVPRILINRLIDAGMYWLLFLHRRSIERAFQDPARVQDRLLAKIVAANAETEFGKEHGFAAIQDMASYRANVPVQTFDTLQPYIRRQMAGAPALTIQPPVYYAKTSGTTGKSKFIPVTETGLRQMRLSQRLLSLSAWKGTGFFSGAILGMASPTIEGRLENGVAYGSSSGSAYRSLSRLLTGKFVAPAEAFEIADVAAKYQIYALAVLSRPDISGVAAANPSSILKVCEIIEADLDLLLDALETRSAGNLNLSAAPVADEIFQKIDTGRLRKLRLALQTDDRLTPELVWPNLAAIATWTGGSCGVALAKLRQNLPAAVKVVEYGYAASEFMGTFNFDAASNICMPFITEHVYEFVLRRNWDENRPEFLGIQDLVPGEEFYVFVTTQSGLYRYDINDLLLANPGVGNCPSLSFLQKGRGVTNITGEKLSEHHVISAGSRAIADAGLKCSGFMFLANENTANYEFLIECDGEVDLSDLAEPTDQHLQALNSEYADKRASNRIYPPIVRRLKAGTMNSLRDESVARGVREAQYKPVVLDYKRDWSAKLAPWITPDHATIIDRSP
jgi:hypothetical protein